MYRYNTNLAQKEVTVHTMFQRMNSLSIMILVEFIEGTYRNTIIVLGQATLGGSLCLLEWKCYP